MQINNENCVQKVCDTNINSNNIIDMSHSSKLSHQQISFYEFFKNI